MAQVAREIVDNKQRYPLEAGIFMFAPPVEPFGVGLERFTGRLADDGLHGKDTNADPRVSRFYAGAEAAEDVAKGEPEDRHGLEVLMLAAGNFTALTASRNSELAVERETTTAGDLTAHTANLLVEVQPVASPICSSGFEAADAGTSHDNGPR